MPFMYSYIHLFNHSCSWVPPKWEESRAAFIECDSNDTKKQIEFGQQFRENVQQWCKELNAFAASEVNIAVSISCDSRNVCN